MAPNVSVRFGHPLVSLKLSPELIDQLFSEEGYLLRIIESVEGLLNSTIFAT